MKTNFDLELLFHASAELGEGPCYVEEEERLYWNDIHGKKLLVHDLKTGLNYSYQTPWKMGWMVKRKMEGFIVGTEDGLKILKLNPFPSWENLLPDHQDPVRLKPGMRLNDGKADKHGNLFFGTMNDADHSQEVGELYKLSPDLKLERIDEGYMVTNGPCFFSDGSFLHNNTPKKTMFKFSSDPKTKKEVWKILDEKSGYPDGMTTDKDDNVWSCEFNGNCVKQYSKNGDLLAKISLPVRQVTNCTFGGPNFSWLFITSASEHFTEIDHKNEPLAGSLWVVKNPGTLGLAANRF